MGINENVVRIFEHFYPMWIKFGAADTHTHVPRGVCYVKIGAKEAIL